MSLVMCSIIDQLGFQGIREDNKLVGQQYAWLTTCGMPSTSSACLASLNPGAASLYCHVRAVRVSPLSGPTQNDLASLGNSPPIGLSSDSRSPSISHSSMCHYFLRRFRFLTFDTSQHHRGSLYYTRISLTSTFRRGALFSRALQVHQMNITQ